MADDTSSESRLIPLLLRLLTIVGGLLFLGLCLSPKSATRIYTWPWIFYYDIMLATPLAGLLILRLGFPQAAARLRGSLPIALAVLAVVIVASALCSPFARQSVTWSLPLFSSVALAYCLLFYLHTTSAEEEQTVRWNRLAVTLGLFFAIFIIVSLWSWIFGDLLPAWHRTRAINSLADKIVRPFDLFGHRNQAPMGHPNYTTGMAVLMLPWLGALALTSRGARRLAWTVVFLLGCFLLFSASSRGAIVGLVGFGVAALAIALLRGRISRKRLGIAAAIAAAAIIIFAVINPRIRDLAAYWADHHSLPEGDVQRLSMAEAGWHMGVDRWWIGYGPDVTPLVYPAYRAELTGGVESALQLHSLPVQWWADYGIPGLLAALLLLAAALTDFAAADRLVRATAGPRKRQVLLTAAALSATGYLFFAATDYQLDLAFFGWPMAVNLAFFFCPTAEKSENEDPQLPGPPWPHRLAAFVIAVAAIPSLWQTVPDLHARKAFSAGVDALVQDHLVGFMSGCQSAAKAAPWEPLYLNEEALVLVDGRFLKGIDQATRKKLESVSIDLLRRSLKINPAQELAHFNLGWMLLDSKPAEAASHFAAAAHLVPDKGGVYFGLALALLSQGKNQPAVQALALECLNDPAFLTSPIWQDTKLGRLENDVIDQVVTDTEAATKMNISTEAETRLGYVDKLARWWHGDAMATRSLAQESFGSRKVFFSFITDTGHPAAHPPKGQPWTPLYRAWATPDQRKSILDRNLVAHFGREPSTATLDTLATALDSPEFPWKALLRGEIGNRPPWLRVFRRDRLGYGVLMRNNDGTTLDDTYVVEENGIVDAYFHFLFPEKGYLPGTVSVRLLDQIKQ